MDSISLEDKPATKRGMLSELSSMYDPLGLVLPFLLKVRRIIHFSDAPEDGYGQVSYLRRVNDPGVVHCVLLIGKARVSPLKYASIPRLALVATRLFVKIALLLREKLDIEINKEYFWIVSKVALGYIHNSNKWFKVFVANRIQLICDQSDVAQGQYVPTVYNPADDTSRGLDAIKSSKSQRWFKRSRFLSQPEDQWPK